MGWLSAAVLLSPVSLLVCKASKFAQTFVMVVCKASYSAGPSSSLERFLAGSAHLEFLPPADL